jgi:hypothetical protein
VLLKDTQKCFKFSFKKLANKETPIGKLENKTKQEIFAFIICLLQNESYLCGVGMLFGLLT